MLNNYVKIQGSFKRGKQWEEKRLKGVKKGQVMSVTV